MIEENISTPDGKPVAFHNYPADAFPFRVVVYDDQGAQLWEETVEGPGVFVVPQTDVQPDDVRMFFADGSIVSTKEGVLVVGDEL